MTTDNVAGFSLLIVGVHLAAFVEYVILRVLLDQGLPHGGEIGKWICVLGFSAAVGLFIGTAREPLPKASSVCWALAILVWSFLALIFGFAMIYRESGLVEASKPICDADSCIYFSVTTWTTVGYGDITPTIASRATTAYEALTGYVYMALMIAIVTRALTTVGTAEK